MGSDRPEYVPTKLTRGDVCAFLMKKNDAALLLYVVLSMIGAQRDSGWVGSTRRLAAVYKELGRSPNLHSLRDATNTLLEMGLLRRDPAPSQLSVYRLKVGATLPPPEEQGGSNPAPTGGGYPAPVRGSNPAPTLGATLPPPSTISQKGEEERTSTTAGAIPVRGGKLAPGAPLRNGDLGERVRATDPRFDHADEQVMEWVRQRGADEVERQIAAWPNRKTDGLKNASAYFHKLVMTRAAPPKQAAKPKALSPSALSAFLARTVALDVYEVTVADAAHRAGARTVAELTEAQAARLLREWEQTWRDKHPGEPLP